jgi:hypothetical protein
MRRRTQSSTRMLPDGTPLHNQLLAALPTADYDRLAKHLRLQPTVVGAPLHEHGRRIDDVYFPNGGVFSITNRMSDGTLVEVATVGREGMLGVGVFLGDRSGSGRTMQQVPDGSVVALAVTSFLRETAIDGIFREIMSSYAQATLLQTMQCTACNALHDATLLPLAAANSRSSRCGRFSAEAGVSCRHARRSPSDGDGRSPRAQRDGPDLHSVWPHTCTQAQTARSCVV